MTQGVGRTDNRSLLVGGKRGTPILRQGGPRWQRGATGGREVRRTICSVTLNIARHHSAQTARGVKRASIAIGPVDGMPIGEPGENR